MVIQQNKEKLVGPLRLRPFCEAYELQLSDPSVQNMDFDERLALLIDAQMHAQEQGQFNRRMKQANFKQDDACPENIDYRLSRGLDKSRMSSLNSCYWVDRHQNIIITGATGTGKSYLACALGVQNIRKGNAALYYRLSLLLEEMELARADGSLPKLRRKLQKAKVLILDDWAITPISISGRQDLMEIIEDCTGSCSIVITAQRPVENWPEWLGEATLADAILDRFKR